MMRAINDKFFRLAWWYNSITGIFPMFVLDVLILYWSSQVATLTSLEFYVETTSLKKKQPFILWHFGKNDEWVDFEQIGM